MKLIPLAGVAILGLAGLHTGTAGAQSFCIASCATFYEIEGSPAGAGVSAYRKWMLDNQCGQLMTFRYLSSTSSREQTAVLLSGSRQILSCAMVDGNYCSIDGQWECPRGAFQE